MENICCVFSNFVLHLYKLHLRMRLNLCADMPHEALVGSDSSRLYGLTGGEWIVNQRQIIAGCQHRVFPGAPFNRLLNQWTNFVWVGHRRDYNWKTVNADLHVCSRVPSVPTKQRDGNGLFEDIAEYCEEGAAVLGFGRG
jgi:hypothetical protein